MSLGLGPLGSAPIGALWEGTGGGGAAALEAAPASVATATASLTTEIRLATSATAVATATSSLQLSRPSLAMSRLPISTGMALRTREQCKDIAYKIVNRHHAFVLGKG